MESAGGHRQPKRIELLREINSLSIVDFDTLAGSQLATLLYPGLTARQLRQRLQITLQQLAKSGLVKIGRLDGDAIVKATDKGRRRLLRYDLEQMSVERPKKWDAVWRIVIFDIPEKHKAARNALNLKLRSLPMFKLADSIWVSPYPVDGFVATLRQAYGVEPYVRLIRATYLEDERLARNFFNLPSPT